MTHEYSFERGSDGVAVLTLNRPETLNSLTFALYGRLEKLFAELETDEGVKAVVLTGAGKGFCSGGSVEEIIGPLLEADLHETLEFTRMTGAVVRNMLRLSKPIVAAVNGIAAGAGAVLALASDLRVLAEDARFAFLFSKVGLTGADMGAAWLLPRIVGTGRALEMLLLGDKIEAGECHRIGLANRVVPREQVLEEATAVARKLATGPALAHAMTKKLIWNEWSMDLDSAIEQEAQAQALLLRAHDHHEFYRAWIEGRPPHFSGR
ncbi:MAG: enoyl-CoA hydratase family protein [Planctomycetota bacterium]